MYENQDICGAVKVIVVDDPAFERICVGDAERVELKTASVKGTVFGERAHDEI